MARLILRYDDVCELTDTKLERKLLELVAAHGGKMVVAVIPFVADMDWELRGPIPLRPLGKDRAKLLKEFVPRYAEIAMHGYSHQTVTRWSHLFEFGDKVSQKRQALRLRDGRAFLEDIFGVKVTTFVPPWNEYGRTTLMALEEEGFRVLSGDVTVGPTESNLAFIPVCCELSQLEGALTLANSEPDATVCVMVHEYDFKESGWPRSNIDLATFERLLEIPNYKVIQWACFSDCSQPDEWNAGRLVANRRLRDALNSRLRHLFSRWTACVYWSESSARRKAAILGALKARRWSRSAD